MDILGLPLIREKGKDRPEPILRQRKSGLLPHLAQHTFLRRLVRLKFASYSHPFVMVQIVFFFYPM